MPSESKKWLRFRIITLLVFFSRALHCPALPSTAVADPLGKTLKTIAEIQHTKTLPLLPERGIIFDRNGEKLAATIMVDSVCADPSKSRSREVAEKVASILNIDKGKILQKLSASKNFCWLDRRIPPDQAAT